MKDPLDYKIRGKHCRQWTVEELKKALKKRNEKISGSKAELCNRLRTSYKKAVSKASVPKPVKNQQKAVDTDDPLFRFYASTYYQMPGSKMAFDYLTNTYGFTRETLDKHKTLANLVKHLT
jgi:hypothetical protein